MSELDQFIDRAKHLPPAPTLLPELISLLGQPDLDGSRVVGLITYDPGLTANVLRLCNSVALASSNPVATLEEAVVRLGFEEIYRLVVASIGVHALRNSGIGQATRQRQLWSHSVVTAIGAELIARDRGDDGNLAFTAGLLHDIGKIIALDVLGEKYVKLAEEVEANHFCLIEMERKVLGLHHAELGGQLLAKWRLPANLVAAVYFHHDPEAANAHRTLAAYAYLGNLIAYMIGFGCGDPWVMQDGSREVLGMLNFSEDCLPRYIEAIQEEFEKAQMLIQIGC